MTGLQYKLRRSTWLGGHHPTRLPLMYMSSPKRITMYQRLRDLVLQPRPVWIHPCQDCVRCRQLGISWSMKIMSPDHGIVLRKAAQPMLFVHLADASRGVSTLDPVTSLLNNS